MLLITYDMKVLFVIELGTLTPRYTWYPDSFGSMHEGTESSDRKHPKTRILPPIWCSDDDMKISVRD